MSSLRSRNFTQRGVALISVLLIFALLVMVAGAMVSRHFVDVRKTGNYLLSRQAYYYALGGEELAREILYEDWATDRSRGRLLDNLSEEWAAPIKPFDINEGAMTLEIVDLQGRFNINNLVDDRGRLRAAEGTQFRRLLAQLKLNESIAERVLDWLDSGKLTLAGQSEDQFYRSAGYDHLPSNQRLIDISELRLIHGIDAKTYQRLLPHVAVLPATTAVNINTAEAEVLRAMAPSLSSTDMERITAKQRSGGYSTVSEFTASAEGIAFAGLSAQLTTNSSYFAVRVRAKYAQRNSILESVLRRDSNDGKLTKVARNNGVAWLDRE